MHSRSVKPAVLTAMLFFLISLGLIPLSFRYPTLTKLGSQAVLSMTTPLQSGLSYVKDFFRGNIENYLLLINVKQENSKLKERIQKIEMLNLSLGEEREENKRLKKLLNLNEVKGLDGIAAKIIGVSNSDWIQKVTIDRGSKDGIKEGLAVVSGNGLVGIITTVNFNSSSVLLITDHTSSVDVVLQQSRARGVLNGAGSNDAELQYVSRDFSAKVGERVLTSGFDSIYPRGILVGTISKVDRRKSEIFYSILVKTAFEIDHLEEVFIVFGQKNTGEDESETKLMNKEILNLEVEGSHEPPWCEDKIFSK